MSTWPVLACVAGSSLLTLSGRYSRVGIHTRHLARLLRNMLGALCATTDHAASATIRVDAAQKGGPRMVDASNQGQEPQEAHHRRDGHFADP
jgi:hypothetical protein